MENNKIKTLHGLYKESKDDNDEDDDDSCEDDDDDGDWDNMEEKEREEENDNDNVVVNSTMVQLFGMPDEAFLDK